MSSQARPARKPRPAARSARSVRAQHPAAPHFDPVAVRARHDGWSPARQLAFIDALAASGCIHEACASVGITPQSAYRLRARTDAQAFRLAWDAALDFATRRLSDEVFSRAINGVAVPHFYKGELIGEHRRYDERLAMFVLRYRDPLRYAATLDHMVYTGHSEATTARLAAMRDKAACVAHCLADDPLEPDPVPEAPPEPPFAARPLVDVRAEEKEQAKHDARIAAQRAIDLRRERQAQDEREFHRMMNEHVAKTRPAGAQRGVPPAAGAASPPPDVPSPSSLSTAPPPTPKPAATAAPPSIRVI